jgi:hypothetical protein
MLELYCIDIPVLMSLALAYRYCKSSNSRIVALVDKMTYENRNMLDVLENMKKEGIFYDVIEDNVFFDCYRETTISEYEQYVSDYYDLILKNAGYILDDFEKIVCFNDWWDGRINLYFNIKKKVYKWVQLDKNNLQEHIYVKGTASDVFFKLMNKYKTLSPFAPYASPCILADCNMKLRDKISGEVEVFDFAIELNHIPEEIIGKVIEAYGISADKDLVLFLPNSYGYLYDVLPQKAEKVWKEYLFDEWLYYGVRIAQDYYFESGEEIIVKPHPNDPISEERLKKVMNEKASILSTAPWEWLRRYMLIKQIHFSKAIGIASTALDSLDNKICDRKIILGDTYRKVWFFYDAIYVALEYCKNVCEPIVANEYLKEHAIKIAKSKLGETHFDFAELNDREARILWLDTMEYDDKDSMGVKLSKAKENDIVVLFNIGYTNGLLLEQISHKYLSCIEFKLEGHAEHLIDYGKKNSLWIYSRDEKVHCEIQAFQIKEKMCSRQMYLHARSLSRDEMENNLYIFSLQKEVTELGQLNMVRSKQIPKLLWNSAKSFEELEKNLLKESDIIVYLDMLQRLSKKYVIVLAVKDTPGNCMDDFVVEQIKGIGFKNFNNELWRMYIGISIPQGVIIDQVAKDKEGQVYESIIVSGHEIKVWSKPWRNGNIASIQIDDREHAVNKRGINIVLYDPNENKVIDSIAYDAHTTDKRFYR